jgi:hypothetical protein
VNCGTTKSPLHAVLEFPGMLINGTSSSNEEGRRIGLIVNLKANRESKRHATESISLGAYR